MNIDIARLPVYSPYWMPEGLTHGKLCEDFSFVVHYHGDLVARDYEIKKGFVWDGNSIPRIAWSFTGTPWAMDLLTAGLIHDWLYKTGIVSRKVADEIHYKVCRKHGVGWYRAQKMHKALRVAGWRAWNKHRKNDEKD